MKLALHEASRIGGRKRNEDRCGIAFTDRLLLLVLADGMGGHVGGEVAAQMLVDTVKATFKQRVAAGNLEVAEFLLDSIYAAHEQINAHALERQMSDAPRTTCVVAVVGNGRAMWAHVGDSRLYHFDQSGLRFCTHDHSIVQQMVDDGLISPDKAATHPERNKLYNSVGGFMLPNIEVSASVRLSPGDVLLLCSDGLWSELSEDEMFVALNTYPLARAANHMLDFAEMRGGSHADNATLVAMRYGDTRIEAGEVELIEDGTGPQTLPGRALDGMAGEGELDAVLAEIQAVLDRHKKK